MDFQRIKKVLSQDTLNFPEWKGAVLFLCNEDHVFLIKRSDNMPTHGGQIAFVGGHRKETEFDPWIAAAREYEEETHHSSRETLEFLGILPVVMTARMQPIVPVVARLTMPTAQFLKEVRSNGEWDDMLAYPWEEILNEGSWEYANRFGYGKQAIMFHPIRSGTYLPLENNQKFHLLWGATAQMIWKFLRLYFDKPQEV
jgi:8-oxo-dGTP pyrophosphatase MutT (NUDIX family)